MIPGRYLNYSCELLFLCVNLSDHQFGPHACFVQPSN